jgi:hypothetical protein
MRLFESAAVRVKTQRAYLRQPLMTLAQQLIF